MDEVTCTECEGSRLKKESLFFKINDKNIADLSSMDISELTVWFKTLPEELSEKQKTIATEILKEINETPPVAANKGGAIREGVHEELDQLRRLEVTFQLEQI